MDNPITGTWLVPRVMQISGWFNKKGSDLWLVDPKARFSLYITGHEEILNYENIQLHDVAALKIMRKKGYVAVDDAMMRMYAYV